LTLLSASPWRTKAISGKTIENYKSSLKFVFSFRLGITYKIIHYHFCCQYE